MLTDEGADWSRAKSAKVTRELIGRGARGRGSSLRQVFGFFPLEYHGQDSPSSNLAFIFLMSITDMNMEVSLSSK